jgi:phenylalanyl-tRNA synthetase beta chain
MKVSLNWIKEFTDVKLGVEELVAKIGAQLGEVEEVINLGERYEGVVVAKVVACEKHPNADKLNVCLIDDGKKVKGVKRDSKGLVQVVCGAPNVRKGITVAWIPPGAVVPSTFETEKFTLEARELRGIVSNGMLASGKELAINEDHEGILIIDKPCNPGDALADVYKLDDYIIDIENKMFTHRPDCFGQLGVAREIAGIQGIKFTSPDWYLDVLDKLVLGSGKRLKLTVKNELPELVPRFMAVPMSGVTVGKSPIMIQSFLSRTGIKPINNIVDITNFVMSLTAQPMHAYDYDKLAALDGASEATVVVRKPKKAEKVALLNGKTIEPRPDAIMIASAKKLIGVGGIMGGSETEVSMETKNIVLECATFDMYSIRRTSMAHGLFTDAVTRFNKGQSPRAQDKIFAYAVAWVNKLAGGEIAGKVWDERSDVANLRPIKITPDFINERLGSDLSAKQITKLLSNVEFLVEAKKDQLHVTAPYWRTDIEIAEDIVEEVGRLYGYDKLPLTLPRRSSSPSSRNALLDSKAKIRSTLSAAGANELLTYSFVHEKLLNAVSQDKTLAYQLSNALSPDLQYYRLSLLPSLLDKVHANIKAGHSKFAIYEINKTHDKSNVHEDGLPIEEERVAFVFAADVKEAKAYSGSPYYQARAYAEGLLTSFGIMGAQFESVTSHKPKTETGQQALMPFEVGRTAYIKTAEGKLLGLVGEVRSSVKHNLKLPEFTAGFELDIQMLQEYSGSNSYRPLSRFPSTAQDISLKVDQDLAFSVLQSAIVCELAISASEHGYVIEVHPISIYQEKAHAQDKTISFRIVLSHPNRTLTTAEVNNLLDSLAQILKKNLNAERV